MFRREQMQSTDAALHGVQTQQYIEHKSSIRQTKVTLMHVVALYLVTALCRAQMQHYTEHQRSIKHTYHKSSITLNNTNAALQSTDTALHRTQMQLFTERNYTYLHSSTTLSYTGAA